MTIDQVRKRSTAQLQAIYDSREAHNIADWLLEYITGLKKTDRLIWKNSELSAPQLEYWEEAMKELMAHRPVHYVTQHAWFRGLRFYVDENVLIPRPETEELVQWILEDYHERPEGFEILDIGTGSGCIPISLKKEWPGALLTGCDISEKALAIAALNAREAGTGVRFLPIDFLNASQREKLPSYDILVSNPPYISISEKNLMDPHIIRYEPWQALFVQNEDPLQFYRMMARFGRRHLNPGGSIYAEIHEDRGEAVRQLFLEAGYAAIDIKKDLQGKDRICRVRN